MPATALRRSSARTGAAGSPDDVPTSRAVASELVLHRLVRRELRLLAELSAWAPAGDADRTRDLTRHADLLGRLLLHHHAVERELLWPALVRAAPSALPLVQRWTAGVARLDDRLRGLSTAARQWAVASSDRARDAFTLACLDLVDAVDVQTAEEERDLLPLLAAHLSPAAWAEITRAARSRAGQSSSRSTAWWCSSRRPSRSACRVRSRVRSASSAGARADSSASSRSSRRTSRCSTSSAATAREVGTSSGEPVAPVRVAERRSAAAGMAHLRRVGSGTLPA